MQKKPIHRTWVSQNPTMIHSFCKQTFHTSFLMHLWQLPNKIAQISYLHLFTNFVTTAKKPNPLNLAKTHPRSIPFASKLFTPHFLCICDNSPPRLHKNHNFTYSPILLPRQKKPIHRTWLSQNPTMIHSFCKQTFHTSFSMHLWQLPNKIAQKSDIHLFTNFATKAKKDNPPNLAKPKPNQGQFLLTPNILHVIFYAFVTIPHKNCTKTITSLIHQLCYQSRKTQYPELS